MLTVVLWLWGAEGPPSRYDSFFRFQPEHVNRLAAAISANLHMPHNVAVITDYPADQFGSHVRHISLQEHFSALRPMGGCWLRLNAFAPGMGEFLGPRVAWIDLDSIVCGDLTPLFDRPEPAVLFKSNSVVNQPWNGSMILFSPDENARVWTEFDPKTAIATVRAQKFKGTDQAWFGHIWQWSAPHWTHQDGVYHFGAHCSRHKPRDARICTFPGKLKPTDYGLRRRAPWLRELWPMADESPLDMGEVTAWPVSAITPRNRFQVTQQIRREQRQQAREAMRRARDTVDAATG